MRVFLWALFALGLTMIGYAAAVAALIYSQLERFGIADRAWGLLTHSPVLVPLLLSGLALAGASLTLLLRRPRIPN